MIQQVSEFSVRPFFLRGFLYGSGLQWQTNKHRLQNVKRHRNLFIVGACLAAGSGGVRNPKEELMKRIFRWFTYMALAGLFMVSAGVIAQCQDGNPAAASSKTVNEQHRRELQDQRHRIKQSRQDVRAEVRQSGHHATPPKAERHQTRKVRNQSKSQNPNLRHAQKDNRNRRPTHPQVQTN
jgi:hypothetical protein